MHRMHRMHHADAQLRIWFQIRLGLEKLTLKPTQNATISPNACWNAPKHTQKHSHNKLNISMKRIQRIGRKHLYNYGNLTWQTARMLLCSLFPQLFPHSLRLSTCLYILFDITFLCNGATVTDSTKTRKNWRQPWQPFHPTNRTVQCMEQNLNSSNSVWIHFSKHCLCHRNHKWGNYNHGHPCLIQHIDASHARVAARLNANLTGTSAYYMTSGGTRDTASGDGPLSCLLKWLKCQDINQQTGADKTFRGSEKKMGRKPGPRTNWKVESRLQKPRQRGVGRVRCLQKLTVAKCSRILDFMEQESSQNWAPGWTQDCQELLWIETFFLPRKCRKCQTCQTIASLTVFIFWLAYEISWNRLVDKN